MRRFVLLAVLAASLRLARRPAAVLQSKARATSWTARPRSSHRLPGANAPRARRARGRRPGGAVRVALSRAMARAACTWARATRASLPGGGPGKGTLLFDAPELEVHAWPSARTAALRGHVARRQGVRRRPQRQVPRLLRPARQYIWAMAFDDQGRLLVATGSEGDPSRHGQGQVECCSQSPEGHITALVADGGATCTRAARGRRAVSHRPRRARCRAARIALPRGQGGRRGAGRQPLAALVDGKGGRGVASHAHAPSATGPARGEVTVSESFSWPGLPRPPLRPRRGRSSRLRTAAQGRRGEDLATGEVDSYGPRTTRCRTRGGHRHGVLRAPATRASSIACARTARGRGDVLPREQVTSLVRAKTARFFSHLEPRQGARSGSGAGRRAPFTSRRAIPTPYRSWGPRALGRRAAAGDRGPGAVAAAAHRDAGQARGRRGPLPIPTGRHASPSEAARFLQLRGRCWASRPIRRWSTPWWGVPAAQPAAADPDITVHPPGEVFQKPISLSRDVDILGLDEPRSPMAAPLPPRAPPACRPRKNPGYSRRLYQKGVQTFSGRPTTPRDTLVYACYYRPRRTRASGRSRRASRRRAGVGHDHLPNGRYVIRVTASDSRKPGGMALTGEESVPLRRDNTPPLVQVRWPSAGGRRARARSREGRLSIRAQDRVLRRREVAGSPSLGRHQRQPAGEYEFAVAS